MRLMRATKSVDVVLLHDEEIALGELERYRAAKKRMMFVAVNTSKADSLSVDCHETIFELNLSEPNALLDLVEYCLGVLGLECEFSRVKIWRLSSPLLGVFNINLQIDLAGLSVDRSLGRANHSPAVLRQL
jgi:hypothetical protein